MKLFVSYSRADVDFVCRLRDEIHRIGFETWLDIDDIPAGSYWPDAIDAIDAGLKEADVIIGILSPESVASRNVQNEWDWSIVNNKPLFLLQWRECSIPHRYLSINSIDFSKSETYGLAELRAALHRIAFGERQIPSALEKTIFDELELRNRKKLLHKVRKFWIEGVLENSLHHKSFMTLNLKKRLDAVKRPWNIALELPDQSVYLLPDNQCISDVFDDIGHTLLILGQPGSGKTTIMLELARERLIWAEQQVIAPVPVIFNLSSWSGNGQHLVDWLVRELNLKYQVPMQVGRSWLDNQSLMLMLDGLDEVKQELRNDCIRAINDFRYAYGLTDLVLCSREQDYEELSESVLLDGAISLQPLTSQQIDAYLSDAAPAFDTAQRLLRQDPLLQNMLKTPLDLSIFLLAVQRMSKDDIASLTSNKQYRAVLFDLYIHYMLEHRKQDQPAPYSHEQTRFWLRWLARKLAERSQTLFLIEDFQPDWLAGVFPRLYYVLGVRFVIGVLLGLSVGFADGLAQALISSNATFGLVEGILAVIVSGFSFWMFFNIRAELIGRLVIGIVVGVIYGQFVEFAQAHYTGNTLAAAFGVASGFASGSGLGLFSGLFPLSKSRGESVKIAEILHWSWRRALRGLLLGTVFGFLVGMVIWVSIAETFGFPIALAAGLSIGLVLGLVPSVEVGMRARPNEGLWRTARNALWVASIEALLSGVIFGVYFGSTAGPATGWSIGPAVAVVFFCVGFLTFGGLSCIRHLAMRIIFFRRGVVPWNYARFLDYTVEKNILQCVGNGYVFVHRLLLEHLAREVD